MVLVRTLRRRLRTCWRKEWLAENQHRNGASQAMRATAAPELDTKHHTEAMRPSHVPHVSMPEYSYNLPPHQIARYPVPDRGSSRLLVALPTHNAPLAAHVRDSVGASLGDRFLDQGFADIVRLLPSSAHLVCNESRVFAARVFAVPNYDQGENEAIEVMFLAPEPASDDPSEALSRPCIAQRWRCMVRSRTKALPGAVLVARKGPEQLEMQVENLLSQWHEEGEADGVEVVLRLNCIGQSTSASLSAYDMFNRFGEVPLPPYLKRRPEESDKEAYQTVFASYEACGSVAAPTAGLHFTDQLVHKLKQKGVAVSRLALHVGAGTFRPVTADRIADHTMHEEAFAASISMLRDVCDSLLAGKPLVVVGTTALRALESLYWLGVMEDNDSTGVLGQWDAYRIAASKVGRLPSASEALQRLISRAEIAGDSVVRGSTSLCIVPGYKFRLCEALVTNFHEPSSTLLLLVAALAGRATQQSAYLHAVSNNYRFLSYGDASLFFNETTGSTDIAAGTDHDRKPVKGDRVLLHSCCAPCSGAMIEEMHSQGLQVSIFFYNPNIHPKREYELRKRENIRFAEKLGIPFIDCDYDVDEWYRRAKGMEFCPERGARCTMCFDMRFERTALYASEHGFPYFTTTNATSRWKDAAQVNDSGLRSAQKYPGTNYYVYDWQTQAMTDRKYKINAENRFYKQEYCGCSYSLRDSNMHREANGLPKVEISGDSVYEDPEADAAEESVEVVESFFRDHAEREQRLRKTYGGRRRGGGDENW